MTYVYNGRIGLVLLLLIPSACGCQSEKPQQAEYPESSDNRTEHTMKISSSAFDEGKTIDAKYTVEGQDISPPLAWSDVPAGTQSFALICDDPDAPSPKRPADEPWVHWVLYNIPGDCGELPEALGRAPELETVPGAKHGVNSWPSENLGYRGPAPPPGSGKHRYFFHLYALDTMLDLAPGATKKQLVDAMAGHTLAEAKVFGIYER
jgi:Raf kinase inhibitor-like YbhB/YbcL family protein